LDDLSVSVIICREGFERENGDWDKENVVDGWVLFG